jgi:hypothetical protein
MCHQNRSCRAQGGKLPHGGAAQQLQQVFRAAVAMNSSEIAVCSVEKYGKKSDTRAAWPVNGAHDARRKPATLQ